MASSGAGPIIKNIAYVLFAEFDNDHGSVVRLQYPKKAFTEENLVGYMIADGVTDHQWDWTVFFVNRKQKNSSKSSADLKDWEVVPDDQAQPPPEKNRDQQFYYGLSLTHTKKTDTAARGALIKSIAVLTQHKFFHAYKPFLLAALKAIFLSQLSFEEICMDLYDRINAIDLSKVCHVIKHNKMLLHYMARGDSDDDETTLTWTSPEVRFCGSSLHLSIPLVLNRDEVAETSLTSLVDRFKDSVMIIFSGIFCSEKILFVGEKLPISTVCDVVLSSVLLVCAPLRGILKRRVFPYVHASDLSFTQVDGYIAGTTNPYLEEHSNWDILCNVNTGKVTQRTQNWMSSMMNKAFFKKGPADTDRDFFSKLMNGLRVRYDEQWARIQFTDYTQQLVDLGLGRQPFSDETENKICLELNQPRLAKWYNTPTHQNYLSDTYKIQDKSKLQLRHVIYQLRQHRDMQERDVTALLTILTSNVASEEHFYELLYFATKYHINLSQVLRVVHGKEPLHTQAISLLSKLNVIKVQLTGTAA